MDRRDFLAAMAAVPALSAVEPRPVPDYRVVTTHTPAPEPGIPGRYPGRVVTVHSPACIDEVTEKVDVPSVRAMIARGMATLTGDTDPRDSWARFFNAQDFVGIKVNASGAPGAMSMPEVVAEISRNLITVGVKPTNIVIHERGAGQILLPKYDQFVPAGIRVESASTWLGLDPDVFVEVNFFGEDDTRSYLIRMVTDQFTKIINVPNMKDHGASGVTGCLKNIAYGEFNNVARSHYHAQTETLTYIGTLARVEPLRSRTVLNIMDGLRGVWHAGPFSRDRRYRFYPKQLKFGTDPVAIDRLLIDIIDDKRKKEGVVSVWNRDMKYFTTNPAEWERDPNMNRSIREPGHIEYASTLGLGVYDLRRSITRRSRYEPDGAGSGSRPRVHGSPGKRHVGARRATGATPRVCNGCGCHAGRTGPGRRGARGAEAAAFQDVPAPAVRYLPNVARATNLPWIDSNGWRFARGIRKARYATLPPGSAALAAAEAFVFDVDAILNPDPKDVEELGGMLRFLKALEQPPLPEMVNIGVVDDPSPLMGEVLNLLTRRNLLYKVVKAPEHTLDLTVQLGTPDFPAEAAANPHEFAARVRAKLGDDKRLVRLYGTSTVLARLTGDRTRTRLFLLAFGSRRQQSAGPQAIRARLLGRYQPAKFSAYGATDEMKLSDLRHPGNATEFWVPSFNICAVVDLDATR